MKEITFGDRAIGDGHPCFIVAEAGSNHDGSLDRARQLIDVAAEARADARRQFGDVRRIADACTRAQLGDPLRRTLRAAEMILVLGVGVGLVTSVLLLRS